jgi:hypothetical protein
MKTGISCAIGIVALFLSSGLARANLISVPDITAEFGNVTYSSGTGSFTYQAYPDGLATYTTQTVPYFITAGQTFTLSATISNSGQVTGGTGLTVVGTTDPITDWGNATYSGTLLAASVTAVQFGAVNHDELLFNLILTGGTMADRFGGLGTPLLLDLHHSGGAGTFASNFGMTTGDAYSDVAPTLTQASTPEPATLTILLLGGCVLVAARRRTLVGLANTRRG